jgi:hypothetical protein
MNNGASDKIPLDGSGENLLLLNKLTLSEACNHISKFHTRYKPIKDVPFRIQNDSHSTYTGLSIYLINETDEKDVLCIWKFWRWHSDMYTFNDKGKIKGIQPGCKDFTETAYNILKKLKGFISECKAHEIILEEKRNQEVTTKEEEIINRFKRMYLSGENNVSTNG